MVSYGVLNQIYNDFTIQHYGCTKPGSSGSPIINLENNKVIGVHARANKKKYNEGIFFKNALNEYLKNISLIKKQKIVKKKIKNLDEKNNLSFEQKKIEQKDEEEKKKTIDYQDKEEKKIKVFHLPFKFKNEINIKLKIEKFDIKKDIYFLDNTYNKFHYHDHPKELNESNTILYINGMKNKYKKFLLAEKEGIYNIKLQFNINIQDCSFMFYNCENIIDINLSSFDTRDVTDMSYMFYGCKKITNLDLSSFDTKNVTNMKSMFEGCKKITQLDLTPFDTKNVTKMSCIFSACMNLTSLDLSSFDTENVTDVMYLDFFDVYGLKTVKINTKKNQTFIEKLKKFRNPEIIEV